MKTCTNPKCGAKKIPDKAKFCPYCGATLESEEIDRKEETIEIEGDTTWYWPPLTKVYITKVYIDSILVAEVGYKGKIRIKHTLPCKIIFRTSFWGFSQQAAINIPSNFNGKVILSSNRWTGALQAELANYDYEKIR